MLKSRTVDATKGNLLPSIIIYAIPLMISTLIQTLFNAVDLVVLRYAADGVAVASVGATSTITGLILNTFIGISGGSKVLLARFIGSKDREDTVKTVSTSVITAFSVGLVATIIGLFFSGTFLRLTNCPDDCFDGAVLYLIIYFFAAPAILIYNFGSGILQIAGDTQRPLLYMILSGLTNVILNLILCFLLREKVAAVAIATFASQIAGALLVLRRLTKINGDCRIDLRKMHFSKSIFSRMLRLGLPMCLHHALFPLANLQIQSAINSFGSAAIAGNTAAISVEGIVSSTSSAFSTSALTFIGQNIGAGKRDRVKKSFFLCFSFGIASSLVLGLLAFFGGEIIFSLYVDTQEAIDYAMIRARYIIAFYFIAAMNGIFSSTLQAFGYSVFTSLNSIFAVFIFRMIWMNFIYPIFPSYECVFVCFFVSWLIMITMNLIMTFTVFGKYKRGTLKKII